MLRKTFYGIMGGIVFFLILGIIGAFIGMFIGGAFFEGKGFAGLYDYEAGGNIGLWVFGAIGALLGFRVGMKLSDSKRSGIYRIILTIAALFSSAFIIYSYYNNSKRPDKIDTIEQAQNKADFTIYEPAYLPKDVAFKTFRYNWQDSSESNLFMIRLEYRKNNKAIFYIDEFESAEIEGEINRMLDDPTLSMVEVDILGRTGYLLESEDRKLLIWYHNDTGINLSTEANVELSDNEMIKIARSMKEINP